MYLLEDRLLRIWELEKSGKKDTEISEELGLNKNIISRYRKLIEIEVVKNNSYLPDYILKLYKSGREILSPEKIKEFRKKMGWSQGDMAEKLGKTQSAISSWERGNKPNKTSKKLLLDLMNKLFIVEEEKEDKKKKYTNNMEKNKEVFYSMIDNAETLEAIGESIGVSKQRVEQYLEETPELRVRWENAKKRRKEVKQEIVDVLARGMLKKAEEQEVGEAVSYYFLKRRQASLKKLINLVEAYKNAERYGFMLSYEELGEYYGRGGHPTAIGNMLKCMNLKSLYWNLDDKLCRISSEVKDRIRKAVLETNLSYADIAYFLGLKSGSVGVFVSRKKISARKMGWRKSEIKKFGSDLDNNFGVECLTYREASEIYAFDDEFNSSKEEIAEAIGKSTRFVGYALDNRKEIEPTLIKYLKVLFPEEGISKPYR